MGPSLHDVQVDGCSTAGEINMRITKILIENSTQTTADSSSVGVQVNSPIPRAVTDSSTQTEFVTSCNCRCSNSSRDCLTNGRDVNDSTDNLPLPDDSPSSTSTTTIQNQSTPIESIKNRLIDFNTSDKTSHSNNFHSLSLNVSAPPPPPLLTTPEQFSPVEGNDSMIGSPINFITPPPPPPPPPMIGHSTFPSMKSVSCMDFLMRKYKTLPQSNVKLRTLNWTKVPRQKIEKSVWSNTESRLPILKVAFNEMEELFCQTPTKKSSKNKNETLVRRLPSRSINILDNQRSFLVNIFLKQFKENIELVINSIRNGSGLPAENLKALKKLLPEKQELTEIKAHANCENLGVAENFFLHLSGIPDYELRVQAMIYKEEFHDRYSDSSSQLDRVFNTCEFLINDSSLQKFLTLVLHLGNRLNAGSYAGNAVGFTLSTLPMLTDIKANKQRITFLHYVVDVASTNDSSLLEFRAMVSDLQELSKTPISCIEEEVHSLAVGINEINKKLKSSKLSSQFGEFFQNAKKKVDGLAKKVKSVKGITSKLAVHFCEDSSTFQLNECFSLFANFFEKVNTVLKENEQMKKVEERREKMKVESEKNNKRTAVRRNIFQDDMNMVDRLMQDIKSGLFKLKSSEAAGASQPQSS